MVKPPKPETLERFRKVAARRAQPIGEPRQDVGPSRVNMVAVMEKLASGPIHGTVLKRLKQPK